MSLSTCLRGMTKNSSFWRFHELLPQFWDFEGDLQGPWHSAHFSEAWPNTHHFCILGPFSWDIAHSFGVPEWFTSSMTLSTCLRGMTKNSSFLHFRAVFMSYCPQFWGFRVIYKVYVTQYMFESMTKNSSFLRFRAVFVSYCPLFWGSMEIYKEYKSLYILERNDKNDLSFLRVRPFLWDIAHNFGVSGWSPRPMTLSTCLRGMRKKLIVFAF
jgi:hypothetical protein